ncbi:hypothetical protein BRC89_08845 [Halobacteriales archaeon QS_4_70_19]|nr:MAG: hypothetical protein BRC89_08845 [Halobacteriales archaeon QS_4_70_19]
MNGRLLATGPDAEATVRELASGFAAVGDDFYRVGHRLHTGEDATDLAEAITNAEFREADSLTDTLRRRLDTAGLDADGEVIVTGEAERTNHDLRTGVPADYDAMAACEPEEALWVVRNRDAAHDVLGALNDPIEGEQRVEKTYSENSPPRQWKIDTDGFTDVLTLGRVRNRVEETI